MKSTLFDMFEQKQVWVDKKSNYQTFRKYELFKQKTQSSNLFTRVNRNLPKTVSFLHLSTDEVIITHQNCVSKGRLFDAYHDLKR